MFCMNCKHWYQDASPTGWGQMMCGLDGSDQDFDCQCEMGEENGMDAECKFIEP